MNNLDQEIQDLLTRNYVHPLHLICKIGNVELLKKYLNSHRDQLNFLDNNFHCLFVAISGKQEEIIRVLLSFPELNLSVQSPAEFTVWDYLIQTQLLNLAPLFTEQQIPRAWVWDKIENDALRGTPISQWLTSEKLFLVNFKLTNEQKTTSSLKEFIHSIYPNLNNKNLNLVMNKMRQVNRVDKPLLDFLKLSYELQFDINTLSFVLESSFNLNILNALAKLIPVLTAYNISLERFFKNTLTDLKKNKATTNLVAMYTEDTLNALTFLQGRDLLNVLPKKYKVQNLRKIHKLLTTYHRNFTKNIRNFELNLENNFPELSKIKDQMVSAQLPYTVVIPQDSYELCLWGVWMDNCIASYSQSCADKKTIILAFFDQNHQIKLNVEIYKNRIKQIFKKNNKPASSLEKNEIETFLLNAGLISQRGFYVPEDMLEEFENLLNFESVQPCFEIPLGPSQINHWEPELFPYTTPIPDEEAERLRRLIQIYDNEP